MSEPASLLDGAQWTVRSASAGIDALPATVPGTVAGALCEAGWDTAAIEALDLDAHDWTFATTVDVPDVRVRLEFDAIATLHEVWVDGELRGAGESMFAPLVLDDIAVAGTMELELRCRSLTDHLSTRRARGRWRSSMVAQQGLRWVRTSMLGRAPVFSGVPPVIGPFRAVRCVPVSRRPEVEVFGRWDDRARLLVRGRVDPSATVEVRCAGVDHRVSVAADGSVSADLTVDDVAPWWPHTHGEPALHPVTVRVDAAVIEAAVGFRSVEFVDRTLSVNGVPVFCRGGCWVPLDPLTLQNDPAALRGALTAMRDAGLNTVRLTGTMVYEARDFFSLCDELGILVWQDLMLATLDPPTELNELIVGELATVLSAAGPSLAVISGGSETAQQPTMLGLGVDLPLLDAVLPAAVAESERGVAYVPSTPSGGDLATHVGSGVAHYFGVGGYLRPLSDIRSSAVRFAAECLAFSVPPERRAVDAMFGSASPAGHHPRWKAAVPRDRGSSWDFEDVRDHYVRELFGVEPSAVRRDDPERYLDHGRAAICEAVSAAYPYWRGARSGCGGALVLTLRDLEPGAGWGFSDSAGVPKAPWYALARASAPTAVLVTDEGMDGLRIEVVHDGPEAFDASIEVRGVTRTGSVAAEGVVAVRMSAHSSFVTTVDGVIGAFTDATHAHRFGARTYDAVTVRLVRDGTVLAESVTLIGGPALPLQNSVGLSAVAVLHDDSWSLEVSTEFAAQYVCVDVDGFAPADSWFHLAPGTTRSIALRPLVDGATPRGHVRALNSVARGTFSGR